MVEISIVGDNSPRPIVVSTKTKARLRGSSSLGLSRRAADFGVSDGAAFGCRLTKEVSDDLCGFRGPFYRLIGTDVSSVLNSQTRLDLQKGCGVV